MQPLKCLSTFIKQQNGGRASGYRRIVERYAAAARWRGAARRRSSAPRPRCRGDRTCSCTLCTLHSRADCDAWPATDRRPPCRSLPVRACRLPACPASVFACLLCGQAGPHSPRTTSRDSPGRAAWVTFGVYEATRPAAEPARRPLTYKTARPTNRPTRWGRPAAEAAQCDGRRNGGGTMTAGPWKPSRRRDPAAPA